MKLLPGLYKALVVMISASILLTGCVKDKATRTYTIFTPVYKTTAEVRANMKTASPEKIDHAGKLVVLGKYIFLNEVDRGVHIIDNSNPSSPRQVAFVNIPGNLDLAVKGNVLYADSFTDLVALDVSDPLRVSLKKVVEDAFPERLYANGFVGDTTRVIVDWLQKDTTVAYELNNGNWGGGCPNCSLVYNSASSYAAPSQNTVVGTGGSMARFTIIKESLFTVGQSSLSVYGISTPENPVFSSTLNLAWGIETVYPFRDRLFIGSTSGMFIYDVSSPATPTRLGQFSHVTACDPVIADDDFAFVTLRSGTRCSSAADQLDVLDVNNLTAPSLVKSYPMSNPHGLAKDGGTLFICDGTEGLKVYDASDVRNLKLVDQVKGFESFDVIAMNKLAIVVSKDGLREFDYSDPAHVRLLSRLEWAN
jgi:hypothetical protein